MSHRGGVSRFTKHIDESKQQSFGEGPVQCRNLGGNEQNMINIQYHKGKANSTRFFKN